MGMTSDTPATIGSPARGDRDLAWFTSTIAALLGVSLLATILLAAASLLPPLGFVGLGLLIGTVGFAVGGLIGFLFGVPRSRPGPSSANAGPPIVGNTNLEQLSDWLTKILIGVGLVQIHEINLHLVRFRQEVESALSIGGAPPPAAGMAGCLILIGAMVAGFLSAYLKAKTDLMRAFRASAESTTTAGEPE